MSMGQSMTPADVAAVVDNNRGGFGYGYPVMPMMPFGGFGGGYGSGFGGDFIWVILLLALFGGWGGGFGGGFAGGGLAGGGLLGYAIGNNATKGDLSSGLTNVQNSSKLDSISTQLCNGFSDVQSSICNGVNTINTGLLTGFGNTQLQSCQNTNAITNAIDNNRFASMQSANAIQAQIAQNGFNAQQCCCDTKASIADLKYTVATENCADRAALQMGVRDIITNQTASTQAILDKLCDQELQAERRENQNLRSELMYARGQASQVEQTAQLRASLSTIPEVTYNFLSRCPVGTTPVYGNSPIFTCSANLANNNWNNGCGCGSQFIQ